MPHRIGYNALAGAALVLFLAAGLASNVYDLGTSAAPLTKDPATWPTFLNGKVTKQIADRLADTPLPSGAAHVERGASWIAIGDLGPRVREGCPGWLFLTDERTPYANGTANAAARAATVTRVAERLKTQGIDLVVAVVPDKSRIEHDQLCGLAWPAAFKDRASSWLAALDRAGVPTIDLEPALTGLPSDPFLRTDTHWNETGAQAAAAAIAQRLRALPGAGEKLGARQTITMTQGKPTARLGDLTRLAGIDWLPVRLQPPQDIVLTTTFKAQAADARGGSVSEEDALFGDEGLPTVAVIGTSFSRNSNFISFLEASLHAKVANFARDGGEFAGAAHAYFASPAFKQTPPKVLVWEIPERSLQRPLAGEEKLD